MSDDLTRVRPQVVVQRGVRYRVQLLMQGCWYSRAEVVEYVDAAKLFHSLQMVGKVRLVEVEEVTYERVLKP